MLFEEFPKGVNRCELTGFPSVSATQQMPPIGVHCPQTSRRSRGIPSPFCPQALPIRRAGPPPNTGWIPNRCGLSPTRLPVKAMRPQVRG